MGSLYFLLCTVIFAGLQEPLRRPELRAGHSGDVGRRSWKEMVVLSSSFIAPCMFKMCPVCSTVPTIKSPERILGIVQIYSF